jgi:hypothetical protein
MSSRRMAGKARSSSGVKSEPIGSPIVPRERPLCQARANQRGFYGIPGARELYKPRVTVSLPWWRRIGLAFGVFFRILFDARYASSLLERLASPVEPGPPARPASAESPDAAALVLLSLLQAEGRFVDFVQQDIAGFPDAEVGAVARVVHSGCRKVIASHLSIAAIRAEAEGQRVALEPGFDPSRIKLTGNVAGKSNLSGVLRHRGWQATEVHLPTVVDRTGSSVLCPAEVEL